MSRHLIYTAMIFGIALILVPEVLSAVQAGTPFGGDALNTHANDLSKMLFGPVAKIASIFGGIAGIIYGYLQQSFVKMLTFGGIMLVSAALPTFINVFHSMLLP